MIATGGKLARRLRAMLQRTQLEHDMTEEMRFHVEMEARDLRAQGFSESEAEREARLRFGGVERYKEEGRDARGARWLEDAGRDIRYGLRALRRSPGFAVVAVVTLALGIGATTTIFSAVNGVLMRPLPYENPGQLVRLLGHTARTSFGTVAYLDVLDFRSQSTLLEEAAAYDEWTATLTGGDAPERVDGASVTSSFFRVLGVRPWLGRYFRPEEDSVGHDPVVVLSHGLWTRRFGTDRDIVGQQIPINGTQYRVVGITPPDFEDPSLTDAGSQPPQLWRVTPPYFNPKDSDRSSTAFAAVARLRNGVEVNAARTELSAIASRLALQYPEANSGRGVRVVTLKDQITAPVRDSLLLLLVATGLLVLIACVNIANLMLARASGRAREMALRTALGAGRGRLARQLLSESLVLAAIGGALGILLAYWSSAAIVAVAGESLARSAQIRIDGRVLGFALMATLLTGLGFGLLPAMQTSLTNAHSALKEGSRGSAGRAANRFRNTLVAVQVAISVVLLASAGLLLRSLWSLESVDPGFRAAGVLTLQVDPSGPKYASDTAVEQLYSRALDQLSGLPGVQSVGTVDILPMSGGFNGMGVVFLDRPAPKPAEEPSVETRAVSPNLFTTLGIPLRRGRAFSDDDRSGAPNVAIVDEAMARRFWPGQDPIGKRIAVFNRTEWEVVGVVGSVRQFTLDQSPAATLYLPRVQVQEFIGGSAIIVLRTAGNPETLTAPARSTLKDVAPDVAVSSIQPIDRVVGATLLSQRLRTFLLSVFAAIAFVIGVVGIYGVVAYGVSRRMAEFGIRIALGAQRNQIVRLVMLQSMRPTLAGMAVGVVVAFVAGRALTGLLYGVSAVDPVTYAGAVLGLGAAAAVAAYVPARRATQADPIVALKSE
ncbi:MAG: ABC transporter permease [Anaerolineae bacterium]|nr:ABC transporter permease [Gemmatimonadaceae bacterium]